jgi:putative membrane protein
MIKRYSDHAANERTFLAWVRTAIAVMAFGFIIERFDLFLKVAAPQLSERQLAAHGERFANWAGLAFIVIGVITIVIAGLRFTRTAKDIEINPTRRHEIGEHCYPREGLRPSLATLDCQFMTFSVARELGDIRRDRTRFGSLHFPRLRFLWRLPPFPFAGLLIVASGTALDHFVAVFVACHDERNETAAAKAKPAKSDHDDNLQQFITHRNNSGSLAIFAATRLASSFVSSLAARAPGGHDSKA